MKYTKSEILEKIKDVDLEELYTNDVINYLGKTSDTKEKYSEVISKEIFDNKSKYDFSKIKTIERTRTYNANHSGEYNPNSSRREEIIAMKMYNNKKYDFLGNILDYQVPLKDTKNTKAGKIDLISYKDNTLYLIELKNDRSKETLLRCILEITTYYNQVNRTKLLKDYSLPKNTKVQKAILIFKETKPYTFIEDEYVNKLIKKYDIELFIGEVDEKFLINKN